MNDDICVCAHTNGAGTVILRDALHINVALHNYHNIGVQFITRAFFLRLRQPLENSSRWLLDTMAPGAWKPYSHTSAEISFSYMTPFLTKYTEDIYQIQMDHLRNDMCEFLKKRFLHAPYPSHTNPTS